MKKIPLGTKIILTTAGLVAMAGIFYAANPRLSRLLRHPPNHPTANPQPFAVVPAPIGVAGSRTDVFATEYCSQNIDKIDCFGNVSILGTLPPTGGCGEKYMTIAPAQSAMAGFTPRDIFITSFITGPSGSPAIAIYKLRPPNPTPTLFVQITQGNTTDHTGITFDHVGTFGYNMIVTTENGLVFVIDGNGNGSAAPIKRTGTELEGPA